MNNTLRFSFVLALSFVVSPATPQFSPGSTDSREEEEKRGRSSSSSEAHMKEEEEQWLSQRGVKKTIEFFKKKEENLQEKDVVEAVATITTVSPEGKLFLADDEPIQIFADEKEVPLEKSNSTSTLKFISPESKCFLADDEPIKVFVDEKEVPLEKSKAEDQEMGAKPFDALAARMQATKAVEEKFEKMDFDAADPEIKNFMDNELRQWFAQYGVKAPLDFFTVMEKNVQKDGVVKAVPALAVNADKVRFLSELALDEHVSDKMAFFCSCLVDQINVHATCETPADTQEEELISFAQNALDEYMADWLSFCATKKDWWRTQAALRDFRDAAQKSAEEAETTDAELACQFMDLMCTAQETLLKNEKRIKKKIINPKKMPDFLDFYAVYDSGSMSVLKNLRDVFEALRFAWGM